MPADFLLRARAAVSAALLSGLALAGGVTAAPAQQEAVVEQLAPVLAAEDSRSFQPARFRSALVAPDSVVRRLAAMAAGRIGDLRATPLLVPLLTDPDSTVRVAAAFALGLVRDTAGARPLMDRITGRPALDSWRLGRDAPVSALLPFLEDTSAAFRWRAAFTLGRVRAAAAANRLTVA